MFGDWFFSWSQMVTCTAVSFGREYPGYSDDTVVQDWDAEGDTDECIDSETDEDFFETEFDESRVLVVTFFTISKASFKLLCSSVKCLAFFICKGDENVGQQAVLYGCTKYILPKTALLNMQFKPIACLQKEIFMRMFCTRTRFER